MALLRALGLSHAFEYPLFESLSFSLEPGETMAIVGVSGCGKSTLLHCCSTLLKPNSGEIYFHDKQLYGNDPNHSLHVRREDFGIIFQSHYLFKGFNARENVELAALLAQSNIDESMLKNLGIDSVMHQKIGELSGGQQQRVSIARVLAKRPKMIFADEPTGNLDSATANEVMDVLFQYVQTQEAALMLVTHDNSLARRCNHVFALRDLGLQRL
jgi:putative ABC transport system ATP-binding protein